MHHKDLSFSLFLLIIFLPLSVYRAGGQSSQAGLAIDSAYLNRMRTPRLPESFEEDKGTVHVFLNNLGNRAAEIREGLINGVPLTNHHEFLWYRISPNPIPPMESGEIVVKLRKPLLRFSQSEGAQFRLATDTGKELSTSIPLTSHPFHFTFIGFSDSMDTIYLYLKNSGQTILSLDRVYLSARDVTPKCRIPEHEADRDKKLLAVVELDKPLIKGQYVNVKVTTKQGVIAQSRVRAFSEFPLVELDNKRNIDLIDKELRRKWLVRLRRLRGTEEKVEPQVGNDFYKVIVTNNLFRPLGYRKPIPAPVFELLATVISHKSGKSKALLRNNKDRKTYYVGVGEKLVGALVEKIEPDSVTISRNGKSEEFRLQRDALLY